MAKSGKSKKGKKGQNSKKSNSNATADHAKSASSSANQQVQSMFMHKLPQEIRDEIYANVFCSTRLAFGERSIGRIDRRHVVSSARGTALALLRTCRRMQDEIGVSWLPKVLFHFEDPESLLNKLAIIPITTRKQIRHVRVSGDPLMISWEDDDVYYRTAQALKLLPGLQLDTLTILGNRGAAVGYHTLNMLVRCSDGWKELHYLSHTSELLGYKEDMSILGVPDPLVDQYLRRPQPTEWQRALEQRDGQASNPSVVIYRATISATPGAVLQSDTRKLFTQAFTADQDARNFGQVEDAALMRPEEIGKELLIVVKRGDGVDYAEKEDSPHLAIGDIREDLPGMTWKDIKADQDAFMKRHDDDDYFESDDDDWSDGQTSPWRQPEKNVIVDTYSHVDEYTWPPLHFSKD
jgi:hypothetical protein